MVAVQKNPVLIIAALEHQGVYQALPLWDEQIEFYTFAAASRHTPPFKADLILLDCGFDDDLGLMMLRELKLKNQEIPVMFITSAGSERTAVDAFRLGTCEYVKQPVDLIILRNTVKNLLEVQRSDSWSQWCRQIASQTLAPSNSTGHDVPPHILRCITYIKENFSTPISLDTMAREGGLSKSYFCREFKKTMGMTPMHFLSRLRIKRSKDLLRKDIPISAIAMKVGFNDLSSFNRHFRDMVGQTPTDFRKSHCPD